MNKLTAEQKTYALAALSSAWNIIYGLFNLYLMIRDRSYWHSALAAYFISLGIMRFLTVLAERKQDEKIKVINGLVMLFLAVVIAGMNVMTIKEQINPEKNMVIVIAQAAFTFTIFVMAIVNSVKARKKKDLYMVMIRNISFASAIGSMLSLERTMLGTFGDPSDTFTLWMEAATGMGAFILLVLMAIDMLRRGKYQNEK